MPDLVEAGFYRDIKVMYDTLVCTVASSNEVSSRDRIDITEEDNCPTLAFFLREHLEGLLL